MKRIIIILLIILIVPKSVSSQDDYISNYTKVHSEVVESFTDAYLERYRKLSDGYVNNDVEDEYGIPVFYLYKNEDIYIHTVFLTDGISLVFTPQKFYSNPKTNDFEIQTKDIHDYIVDTGISYNPRLEGKFSATGDNDRLRYKYTYGEMEQGSQPIKKENEIRIIYYEFILNKSVDGRKKYAEYIADLDFVQDKWIVENYQSLDERPIENNFSHSIISTLLLIFAGLLTVGIYRIIKHSEKKKLGLIQNLFEALFLFAPITFSIAYYFYFKTPTLNLVLSWWIIPWIIGWIVVLGLFYFLAESKEE